MTGTHSCTSPQTWVLHSLGCGFTISWKAFHDNAQVSNMVIILKLSVVACNAANIDLTKKLAITSKNIPNWCTLVYLGKQTRSSVRADLVRNSPHTEVPAIMNMWKNPNTCRPKQWPAEWLITNQIRYDLKWIMKNKKFTEYLCATVSLTRSWL